MKNEIEQHIFEKMKSKDFGESMCNETKLNVLKWTMQQLGKPVLGVVYLVSRYNDGEHPSSDVIKIFQNRIDAEQFVEEMKEKHKDNISFKYKHFYFEIDEMDVN